MMSSNEQCLMVRHELGVMVAHISSKAGYSSQRSSVHLAPISFHPSTYKVDNWSTVLSFSVHSNAQTLSYGHLLPPPATLTLSMPVSCPPLASSVDKTCICTNLSLRGRQAQRP